LPPFGKLPDGGYGTWACATGGADGKVRIWNAETGSLLYPVLAHAAEVKHVSFGPEVGHLLTASGAGGWYYTVQLWELFPKLNSQRGWRPRFPNLLREIQRDALRNIAFSPDARCKVTGGMKPHIRNLSTKQDVFLKHDTTVIHVAYSANGRWVLTVADDGTTRVWDGTSGQLITGPLKHGAPVLHASFHPQNTALVTTGNDGAARVWSLPTGELLFPALRHESTDVCRADFSADGRWLLTAAGKSVHPDRAKGKWQGDAAEGRIWNASTGEPVMNLRNGHATFSPEGERVVIYGSHIVHVKQVPDGKPIIELKHGDGVYDAAFSPDGKRVVTACDDSTARVWDAMTGNPVTPPLQHAHRLRGGFFSPDSRMVFTLSDDESWRVWDAATGAPLTVSFRRGLEVEWDLTPPDRPVADLLQWAELLSASRLDSNGTLVRLDQADEIAKRWEGYRTRYLGQTSAGRSEDKKPSPEK
jgi:WD40 repeat protein